jgi:hypothetical protein
MVAIIIMRTNLNLRVPLFVCLLLAAVLRAQVGSSAPPAANQPGKPLGEMDMKLSREQASSFARLALKGIQQEYPNKPDHVLNGEADIQGPRALHPAFYGSFDWHSSVHGHWMLVRLLRLFPDLPENQPIRAVLTKHLTAKNLQIEANYFAQPNHQTFERTKVMGLGVNVSAVAGAAMLPSAVDSLGCRKLHRAAAIVKLITGELITVAKSPFDRRASHSFAGRKARPILPTVLYSITIPP